MFTAARCAWLDFVEAHRFETVLIALGGFLVLALFSLFHERIGRLPRRIIQLVIAIFIVFGVATVVYEIQSPRDCAASSDEPMSILPLIIDQYGAFILLTIGIAVAVVTGCWIARN